VAIWDTLAVQPTDRGGEGTPQVEGGGGQARGLPSLTKHPPLPTLPCGTWSLDGPRPCPHRDCRQHLQRQDRNLSRGPKKKYGPGDEETCALDVAAQGGETLEGVAKLLGLTRERIRQIEVHAIQKLRRNFPDALLLELVEEG